MEGATSVRKFLVILQNNTLCMRMSLEFETWVSQNSLKETCFTSLIHPCINGPIKSLKK